ncbi:MAG TPA: ATP-binding protein [Thermoleophilia bacterium]|nr:ATP-binding protein [Thermoleophilia bacterium]
MHDLSLYLLDILENSVRAGATVIVTTIAVDRAGDALTIRVEDDGPGLPVEPEQALDPFYTTKTHKKTGLGLSLFRQAAEGAGGGLDVGRSDQLGGVCVTARMSLANVDRPPLGDVAASIVTMVVTNPEIEFRVDLQDDGARNSLRGPEIPARISELTTFQEALP